MPHALRQEHSECSQDRVLRRSARGVEARDCRIEERAAHVARGQRAGEPHDVASAHVRLVDDRLAFVRRKARHLVRVAGGCSFVFTSLAVGVAEHIVYPAGVLGSPDMVVRRQGGGARSTGDPRTA